MHTIKFPSKWYIGFQKRAEDQKLGYMMPYSEDKAGKKRQHSIDSWVARGYYGHQKNDVIPSEIIDDVLLSGYKIKNSISRGGNWNGSADKWRILDPRGFELEITSGNLEMVHKHCTITNGTIQEACRWARYGSLNVLVPEACEEYKAAAENTVAIIKNLSPTTMEPGHNVVLQDGQSLIYLGRYWLSEAEFSLHILPYDKNRLDRRQRSQVEYDPAVYRSSKPTQAYVFKSRDCIISRVSPKIKSIGDKDEKYDTLEKCQEYIAAYMIRDKARGSKYENTIASNDRYFNIVSTTKEMQPTFRFKTLAKHEVISSIGDVYNRYDTFVVDSSLCKIYKDIARYISLFSSANGVVRSEYVVRKECELNISDDEITIKSLSPLAEYPYSYQTTMPKLSDYEGEIKRLFVEYEFAGQRLEIMP